MGSGSLAFVTAGFIYGALRCYLCLFIPRKHWQCSSGCTKRAEEGAVETLGKYIKYVVYMFLSGISSNRKGELRFYER